MVMMKTGSAKRRTRACNRMPARRQTPMQSTAAVGGERETFTADNHQQQRHGEQELDTRVNAGKDGVGMFRRTEEMHASIDFLPVNISGYPVQGDFSAGLLLAGAFVLSPKNIPAPGERQEHERHADAEGYPGDEVIMLHPAEFRQEHLPVVVILHLASGYATQQHELPGACIVHVGGDVQETLPEPPESNRRAEGIPLQHEGAQHDQRHQPLAEGAAEHLEKRPKGEKNTCPASWKGRLIRWRKDSPT